MTTDALIDKVAHALRTARDAVESEIRDYPRPISGCDAQFNYLLAQRQRLEMAANALSQEPVIPTSRNPDPQPSHA